MTMALRGVKFTMDFNTCRLCKKAGYEPHKYPMIKYSTRHYVHADCALGRWGDSFFGRLTPWQLSQFPALAAFDAGLLENLRSHIESQHKGARV